MTTPSPRRHGKPSSAASSPQPPLSRHDLFEAIRRRPGMWVAGGTYFAVASFIDGYDTALGGTLLAGFQEWLVRRLGFGSNLYWVSLILYAAFPDSRNPLKHVHRSEKNEREAIETLFSLLSTFEKRRRTRGGEHPK